MVKKRRISEATEYLFQNALGLTGAFLINFDKLSLRPV